MTGQFSGLRTRHRSLTEYIENNPKISVFVGKLKKRLIRQICSIFSLIES